jgi:hypothetical protein
MKLKLLALMLVATSASAIDLNPYMDYRYCGPEIKRDKDGRIERSTKVLAAFKKMQPCPATNKTYGACPGWSMNHDWPLANGGCDAVFNLTWMRNEIKSCSADYCRDRYERRIFGNIVNKPPPTNLVK